MAFPVDFPPELLARIMHHIPYFTLLLVVPRVCRAWKSMVDTDPVLQMRIFRRPSAVYMDVGVKQSSLEKDSEPLVFHPLVDKVSYPIGAPAAEVYFPHPAEIGGIDLDADIVTLDDGDDDDEEWADVERRPFMFAADPDDRDPVPLADCAVAHDLATIPAVHSIELITMDRDDEEYPVRIENPAGITILDIFVRLQQACKEEVQTPDGRVPLEEALCDIFYEGLVNSHRKGRHVKTYMNFGT
ncbi:F-box domain-containing protein [Mycena indigotica]|uniref:F-box domain-containing protein n=1 Tax=Mycena indigotica TaxID=2126181 RepID=A0A8H6VQA9_9AGAR|nr:F-box domain-containing protein [Mycena indigotica]KAF7289784.1 F-box domain-containing protein [Mycena indigotica]